MKRTVKRTRRYGALAAAVIAALGSSAVTVDVASATSNARGAVFVGTNHNNTTDASEPANQVVYYRRGGDGRLTLLGRFDTGGQGSGPGQRFAGDGLGSGNSVQVTSNRNFLLVTYSRARQTGRDGS